MSDANRVPSDVVDVLDERSDELVDEIAWMERVARDRGDEMDFRSGVFSATSHLRTQFRLDERDVIVVDAEGVQNLAGHLQQALDARENGVTRYHLREATQLLYAMAEGEP